MASDWLLISLPILSFLLSAKMDDLDSLFEGELADINQVFQEFEVKDKQKERRSKTEEEDLKHVQTKVSCGGRRGGREGGGGRGKREKRWEKAGREGERGKCTLFFLLQLPTILKM